MKIEKKAENRINFGEVQRGDMFRGDDDRYYMKLISESCCAYAVNLDTGILTGFSDDEPVTPMPNAKIVI